MNNKKIVEYKLKETNIVGSLECYIAKTNEDKFKSYLCDNIYDSGELYEGIKVLMREILVVNRLRIKVEYQGLGYGSNLIKDVITKYNPEGIILFANMGESQRTGFNLKFFYESNGFSEVCEYLSYPMMLWPEEIAKKLNNVIVI